jgi:hypothetical protein
MSHKSQRLGRTTGKPWKWPTADECLTAHPCDNDQLTLIVRQLSDSARELAAVICRECDMVRQPIHLPVIRLLVLLKTASECQPHRMADNATAADAAQAPDVPGDDDFMEGDSCDGM